MAQAITTNVAPAVRRYTNIPGKVSEEPGGYQFHELGPQGQVTDDPEEFAKMKAEQPTDATMSAFDYEAKIKAEMGDPFLIDVDQEATLMMNQQEPEIFKRWSGDRYKYGGYLPKAVEKKWGEYKQKLLANAQKVARDQKDQKIGDFNARMAAWKTAKDIQLDVRQENRLSKEGTEGQKIKGGLSESQVMTVLKDIGGGFDHAESVRKYTEYMETEEDSPRGRRNALQKTLDYLKRLEDGDLTIEENDGLIAAHGPDYKPKKAARVTAPEGFKDTKRTKGGKKVYMSADGKRYWVQP